MTRDPTSILDCSYLIHQYFPKNQQQNTYFSSRYIVMEVVRQSLTHDKLLAFSKLFMHADVHE
mgnify:CR=1 FL=1